MKKIWSLIGIIGFASTLWFSFHFHVKEFRGLLNLPSLILVGGGHIFILFYCYAWKDIVGSWRRLFQILFSREKSSYNEIIERLVEYSRDFQKRGRLISTSEDYPFLKDVMEVFNNNYTPPEMARILKNKWRTHRAQGLSHISLFDFSAKIVPALGMMGTVLGLVSLLQNMQDFSQVGAGMALALLTTLYGLIISFGFYHPASQRLRSALEQDSFLNALIIEGLELIKNGVYGPILREHLQAFKLAEEPTVAKGPNRKSVGGPQTIRIEI